MKITVDIQTNEKFTSLKNLYDLINMAIEGIEEKNEQEQPPIRIMPTPKSYLGWDQNEYTCISILEVTDVQP